MDFLVGRTTGPEGIEVKVDLRRLYAGERLHQIGVRILQTYRPAPLPPGLALRSGLSVKELQPDRMITVPAAEAEALIKARIAMQISPVRAPIHGWFRDLTSQLDGAEAAYVKDAAA